MSKIRSLNKREFHRYLRGFKLNLGSGATQTYKIEGDGYSVPVFVNEFWTPQQRQANAIHEVSYRACFKPQLPRFFIDLFTNKNDVVYDPFNGRGTTVIEAALMGRRVTANDVNPLSIILTEPRITAPELAAVEQRLGQINFQGTGTADIDLYMFYHPKTLRELLALRTYLSGRKRKGKEDNVDRWIRMVATNRLTGHSSGFFSVYTLPPNQAMSAERQKKVNRERKQKPEYRDVKKLILRKSKGLLKQLDEELRQTLIKIKPVFLNGDASETKAIKSNSVALTVTSPPFLNIVQYADDNWLRCWFNGIDAKKVGKGITMSRTVEDWSAKMQLVFKELYRITAKDGIVAFEVGEVHNGKTKLEETVVQLGIKAGFDCEAVLINQQVFTKTSNIWGVSNNRSGTNSNRIAVFRKKQ